jgi:hypothetical protein
MSVQQRRRKDSVARPRSGQNVICKFSRSRTMLSGRRVCVVTVGDIDLPSNYAGVISVLLDDHGGWRLTLGRSDDFRV